MKRCTICNKPYHIIPFQNGYICEECIRQLKHRCYVKKVDNDMR